MSGVGFTRAGELDEHRVGAGTWTELPEIWAWAHEELSGYSDAEIDDALHHLLSAPPTRGDLYWMEGALATKRRRTSGRS